MNEPLIGLYRCPESLVNLDLAGQLSSEMGYFSFGDGAVCFGRCSVGSPTKVVGNGLCDLTRHVTSDGSSLHLPFDPSEIVDNLRLERYATGEYAGNRAISVE
jgi:hypothetical protein